MPKCPLRNLQRDGLKRHDVPKGRVAYEPSSLDPDGPRESPERGFVHVPVATEGAKTRLRPASFADHYSQARQYFRSMTEPEQRHIVSALAFELAKVETLAIRTRTLGHLALIDDTLVAGVEEALGMEGQADLIDPARTPIDLPLSPTLSLIAKAPVTLRHRVVGALVSDGCDGDLVAELQAAIEAEGARLEIVAPRIGGVVTSTGAVLPVDHTISGGPSVLFDAALIIVSDEGAATLLKEAAVCNWIGDAFSHLKVIGHVAAAIPLLQKAGVEPDVGVVYLGGPGGVAAFVEGAKSGRIWEREPTLRSPG
jgi:catalase